MKVLRILTVLMLICFLVICVVPIHGEGGVYDNVLRLHVLANSDDEEDQRLKLLVRDAVLELCAPMLGRCRSREEAQEVVTGLLADIEKVAKDTLQAAGCDRAVSVELGEEGYPERQYESLSFPSGRYLSLRISIGEAKGQNWWCVLFPPICMSAATATVEEAEDAFIAVGFTPEQYRIITDTDEVTYRLKFKFLEIIEQLRPKRE